MLCFAPTACGPFDFALAALRPARLGGGAGPRMAAEALAADGASAAASSAAAAARHARESRDVARDARRLVGAAIADGAAFVDRMRSAIDEADTMPA